MVVPVAEAKGHNIVAVMLVWIIVVDYDYDVMYKYSAMYDNVFYIVGSV